ncbi:MAG: DNA polymerase, partial [Parvibaculum sp.]
MRSLELLPGSAAQLAALPADPALDILPVRPNSLALAEETHWIVTAEAGGELLTSLNRLSLGAVAIDTEYRFTRPPTTLKRSKRWYDPRTLTPLILSGAAWDADSDHIIRFAVDLREPDTHGFVRNLLKLHAPIVAHNIAAEMKTFWAMGLDPVLPQAFDTWVAAKLLTMGRGHRQIKLLSQAQAAEDLDAKEEAETALVGLMSLTGQCEVYGLDHPFAGAKTALQESFLTYPVERAFTDQQIRYAVADAEATLRLYLAQQGDLIRAGLLHHLLEVETPYAIANARMEYIGVAIGNEKLTALHAGLVRAVDHHRTVLRDAGLENPASSNQVKAFLIAGGYEDRLKRRGKVTTRDEVLEQLEASEPLVTDIRRHRRYARMLSDPLFDGDALFGSDGRVHPEHRHLGAATGRSSCSAPNLLGLTKTFRPIVV